MDNKHIHEMLLKEASEKQQQRYTQQIHKNLLCDWDNHLHIIKDAMARQIGGSSLRNSGWNTTWKEVDATSRIDSIRQEIEEKFGHYFYTIIEGRQIPIKAGIEISEDSRKTGDEPAASIYFRYRYFRTIIPDKNPEALRKSEQALQALEALLPGFGEFQQTIEQLNIPLNPYFHISSFSKNDGRVTPKQLSDFILKEREKYTNVQMATPGGEKINTQSFYAEHASNIQSGIPVRMTDYIQNTRTYDITQAGEIRDHGPLMRAIADKVRKGYGLNADALMADVKNMYGEKISKYNLDPNSKDPKVKGYIDSYFHYYASVARKIQHFFTSGCMFTKEETHPDYHWGDGERGQRRRGLPVEKVKRIFECPKMTTNELRLMLKHLTSWQGEGPSPGEENQFQVNKMTTVYQANGWDSSPNDENRPMLTLPPMRQLPRGEVRYDRDNGNFGRDHLVLNWQTGLLPLITRWGRQCDTWLKTLRSPQVVAQLEASSPEAAEAIKNVISLQTGNRTGAENLLDILNRYPNWYVFNIHHIEKSMSSELRTVNGILENLNVDARSGFLSEADLGVSPNLLYGKIVQVVNRLATLDDNMVSQEINAISHILVSSYQSGRISWDLLTACLAAVNKVADNRRNVKGNGISGLTKRDAQTSIDERGFRALQQYGYQVAKVMDFLYATMARSCHETTATAGRPENFYGHQYSTSSGKSEGGEVILSVRYAYFAPQLTNDPEIAKKIRYEQGKRHVKQRDIYQRQTQHWQRAEPTGRFTDVEDPTTEVGIMRPLPGMPEDTSIRVIENIEYFIGQAAGAGRMHKTLHAGLPWPQMVDLFVESYPDIAVQLGAIFEPMNANLQRLELACKRAVDKVRNGLPVVYVNAKKEETVLTAENIATQEQQLTGTAVSSENQQNIGPEINGPTETTGTAPSAPTVPDSITQPTPGKEPTQWTQDYPVLPDVHTVDVSQPQPPISSPESAGVTSQPPVKRPRKKSMESPHFDYVGKAQPKRSLFKRPKLSYTYVYDDMNKQADLNDASNVNNDVSECKNCSRRLIQDDNISIVSALSDIANHIDQLGFTRTADKIDMLCQELEKLSRV